MAKDSTQKLNRLGLFSTAQAEGLGFTRPQLTRLVKSGTISRIERGIYFHKDAVTTTDVAFKIAFLKFGPTAAIGGLSALFHYQLIEQVPQQTWVLVPPSVYTKERLYRLMRTTTSIDIEVTKRHGYKIATIERSIIEALKYASKFGERTAIGAARKALNNKLTTEGKLGKAAKELGLLPSVQRFFEAIVA